MRYEIVFELNQVLKLNFREKLLTVFALYETEHGIYKLTILKKNVSVGVLAQLVRTSSS